MIYMTSPERGIILAAAEGKRLKPLTDLIPKPLIVVDGKPLIFHSLDLLENLKVKDVVITIHPQFGNMIKASIDKKYTGILNVDFVMQDKHNGIGFAILESQNLIGDEPFYLRFADEFHPETKKLKPSDFDKDGSVLVIRKETKPRYLLQNTNVVIEEGIKKVSRVNRSPGSMPISEYHLTGLMTFPAEFFNILNKFKDKTELYRNGEFSTTHSIQYLIDNGNSVGYVECDGFYANVNNFRDLVSAYKYSFSKIK